MLPKVMSDANTIENRDMFKAYVLGLLAVFVFGATLPVTRIALADFDPWLLTFARALIATILAAGCLLWLRKSFFHPAQRQIFVAGVLLIHGFPGFMAIAMQTVPASHGGVILGFLPLATAAIARLIADERPSMRFWLLTLAGFIIIAAYILLQSDETGSVGLTAGDIWLILAGLSASTGYVLFGHLSRTTAGWEIISRALVLNAPLTLLGCVVFFDATVFNASATGLTALFYLGAFSMFIGFCAWNVALAIGGISRIGQLQLLQVFATIGISAVLLGEVIDALTLGTAFTITVLIAASRRG